MSNPCENCGYHWQEDWESFPSCHYEGPHEWAPCEAADEADRIERERIEWEEEKREIEEMYGEEMWYLAELQQLKANVITKYISIKKG